MIDIFFEIGMPDVLDRADAGLTLEGLLSGEDGHAGSKLGIILKIEGDLPGIVAIEAGHAVFDVCGVTDQPHPYCVFSASAFSTSASCPFTASASFAFGLYFRYRLM